MVWYVFEIVYAAGTGGVVRKKIRRNPQLYGRRYPAEVFFVLDKISIRE